MEMDEETYTSACQSPQKKNTCKKKLNTMETDDVKKKNKIKSITEVIILQQI